VDEANHTSCPKVKIAAWVESLELVFSKSKDFNVLNYLNHIIFFKIVCMTARATLGELVILISPVKTVGIQEFKSFKVASWQDFPWPLRPYPKED
jgi:hypothetical protein